MKKNLPISLLVLCTVFTVLSGKTSYQNLSLQHRSYSIKETGKNELSIVITALTPDEIRIKETHAVDRIPVCHTNNFFDDPLCGNYKKADEMITNQVGRAGIVLVRLYFEFTKFSGKKLAKSNSISVSQKTGG